MDCSICRTPLDPDPSNNIERGKGDFIHVVCTAAPPASEPPRKDLEASARRFPEELQRAAILNDAPDVLRNDADDIFQNAGTQPLHLPSTPVAMIIHPYLEGLSDMKDWFKPGTGERNEDIVLKAREKRTIPCPQLPTPIVRMHGALVYAGPPSAVRIVFRVGVAGKVFLDWTPGGHLEFQRLEETEGHQDPVIVVPMELAFFEVENLRDEETRCRVMVCGFEGRQEGL